MTIRAVVLADTHMRADRSRQLPDAVFRLLEGADVILHAGDLVDESVLQLLEGIAPTYAVLGNNDATLADRLPVSRAMVLAGVPLAMVHDSGPATGRASRMRRHFPDAGIVIFGHSHIPVNDEGLGGQRLFNPGSPTERRRQPHRTAGVLELSDGAVSAARIVIVD